VELHRSVWYKAHSQVVFVDEPISISARSDWSEQERRDFGAMVSSPEELVKAMSRLLQPPADTNTDKSAPILVFLGKNTPAFLNSRGFAGALIQNDPKYLLKVLFDHAANDWLDVIAHKIDVPTAIFTGELSNNLPSQRWMHAAIPNSTLIVYSKEGEGDHLLMSRSSVKFAKDLQAFLERKEVSMDNIEHSITSEVILQSTSAWDGTPYGAYPKGQPELTVLKITVPAHGELPWHTHPMPNAAYVVSGEITIEEQDGSARHFSAGQVIAETVDTFHRGVVGNDPAVFIVFYPGVTGMPLSIVRHL
jgi:quercetin dioxygenase-like cupin family protein